MPLSTNRQTHGPHAKTPRDHTGPGASSRAPLLHGTTGFAHPKGGGARPPALAQTEVETVKVLAVGHDGLALACHALMHQGGCCASSARLFYWR